MIVRKLLQTALYIIFNSVQKERECRCAQCKSFLHYISINLHSYLILKFLFHITTIVELKKQGHNDQEEGTPDSLSGDHDESALHALCAPDSHEIAIGSESVVDQ